MYMILKGIGKPIDSDVERKGTSNISIELYLSEVLQCKSRNSNLICHEFMAEWGRSTQSEKINLVSNSCIKIRYIIAILVTVHNYVGAHDNECNLFIKIKQKKLRESENL